MSKISGKINLYRVIRQIRQQPGIGRLDIAEKLRLDKSTISRLVANLTRSGLVTETPKDAPVGVNGGRKIQELTLNAGFGCIIGIEVQSERVVAVLVDLLGKVMHSTSEAAALAPHGVPGVIDSCVQKMKALVGPDRSLLGIGVGMPGLVDSDHGVLMSSNPLGVFAPLDLGRILSRAHEVPVYIENDARCGCWGEVLAGTAGSAENFLFVLGEFRRATQEPEAVRGPAIGLGFVFNRAIYRGAEFTAGEFKSIFPPEPGNKSQFAMDVASQGRIESDDEAFARFFDELAAHLSLFVNALDLDEIVLGGSLFRRPRDAERILHERVYRNWLYRENLRVGARRGFRVRFSRLDECVVAIGAAAFVLESLFALPRLAEDATVGGTDIMQAAARRRHPPAPKMAGTRSSGG